MLGQRSQEPNEVSEYTRTRETFRCERVREFDRWVVMEYGTAEVYH